VAESGFNSMPSSTVMPALCFFPYPVTQTGWIWPVGLALCAALFWLRD
jgi:hypothetical protein